MPKLSNILQQKVQQKDPLQEIRSDEVQEILSHVPNWMIRWGVSLIFGLILMLVSISWFIKYPDTIQGQAKITTEQPPAKLVSKTGGYIENLYLKNNTIVKKGQVIAEITNSTSKEALEYLLKMIDSKTLPTLDTNLIFGEIQTEYNSLVKNLQEYNVLVNDNYFQNTIRYVNQQINYNKQLSVITQEQLNLMKQELINADEKFKADSSLFVKEVISKYDFYKNQTELNNKKNEYTSLKKTYVQYQITVTQNEKERDDLTKRFEEEERNLKNNIAANKKNIKSYIESWQQNFTFVSPIKGKLSYLMNITDNQYISSESSLFAIIPDNEDYICYVTIKTEGYGKIKKGQKVRIKLNNYPYQQYGQLIGKIKEISQVSNKDNYQIKIQLSNQLITTYHKKIKYTPEMIGSAEIVTRDLRLLERVFNIFRKVFDE